METYEFDAIIKKHDSINAAFIEFPYDVEKEFGAKGQVKVKATFDGYEYRGSLANMGHHCHLLGLTQNVRREINKNPGDIVHVIIKKDIEPRVIEIPEDLIDLFIHEPEAKNFFNSLSYSNRKKYIDWISSAKKTETRNKRLIDSIAMLIDKKKIP